MIDPSDWKGTIATFFLLHGLGLNIFSWKPLGFCTAHRPLLGTINYWNWNALAYFHTTSNICGENTILFWKGFSGFLSCFSHTFPFSFEDLKVFAHGHTIHSAWLP
jgi:hypothetical protein